MEGSVLHFDSTARKGLIRGEDGERYDFEISDWKSNTSPYLGAKVDFITNGDSAAEIYLVRGAGALVSIGERMSEFKGSELGTRIGALFNSGLYNKFGFFAAISLLLTLFLPIVEVPFIGTSALIDYRMGKALLLMLVVLSILFYGGATRLYIIGLSGCALGMHLFLYYDLSSLLHEVNQAHRLIAGGGGSRFVGFHEWFLVNVACCLMLFLAAFITKYTTNEKAV